MALYGPSGYNAIAKKKYSLKVLGKGVDVSEKRGPPLCLRNRQNGFWWFVEFGVRLYR